MVSAIYVRETICRKVHVFATLALVELSVLQGSYSSKVKLVLYSESKLMLCSENKFFILG